MMSETQAVNTVDGTVVWEEAVWDAAYIASPIAVAVSLLAMVVVAFFWPLLAGQWIPRGGGDLVSTFGATVGANVDATHVLLYNG